MNNQHLMGFQAQQLPPRNDLPAPGFITDPGHTHLMPIPVTQGQPGGLTIVSTAIRQDSLGRYCLNDCHRAAGGNPSKRPNEWLRNAQTTALIEEMGSTEISGHPINVVMTGVNETRGIYVAKELVYAYAMWISPAFHLQVIRAFDAMVTGRVQVTPQAPAVPAIPQTLPEALRLAADLADCVAKQKEQISEQKAELALQDIALVEQEEQLAAKDQQITEAAPKVATYNRVLGSDGLYGFREAALLLRCPERVSSIPI